MIVIALAVAAWITVPFIAMNKHGTLARQHHEALRAEVRRLEAARRAPAEPGLVASPGVVPAQRRAPVSSSAPAPGPRRVAS